MWDDKNMDKMEYLVNGDHTFFAALCRSGVEYSSKLATTEFINFALTSGDGTEPKVG